jgi:hypothetical protein
MAGQGYDDKLLDASALRMSATGSFGKPESRLEGRLKHFASGFMECRHLKGGQIVVGDQAVPSF